MIFVIIIWAASTLIIKNKLQMSLENFYHLRGRVLFKAYIVDGSQKRIPKKIIIAKNMNNSK